MPIVSEICSNVYFTTGILQGNVIGPVLLIIYVTLIKVHSSA